MPFTYGPFNLGTSEQSGPGLDAIVARLRSQFPDLLGLTSYAGAPGQLSALGFTANRELFPGQSPSTLSQVLNTPGPIGTTLAPPESVTAMLSQTGQGGGAVTPTGDSGGSSPTGGLAAGEGGVTGGLGALASQSAQQSGINSLLGAAGVNTQQSLFGSVVPSALNPTLGGVANSLVNSFGVNGVPALGAINYGVGVFNALNNPSSMGPAFSVDGVPGYSFSPNQSLFSMSPTVSMTSPASNPMDQTSVTSINVPTGSMIGNATGTLGFSPPNTATGRTDVAPAGGLSETGPAATPDVEEGTPTGLTADEGVSGGGGGGGGGK